ncbi:hypothetical protein H9L19_00340 [Weissella diestrammenae]|uniref:Uncharacterized protein n=1 Tax=Weissella diestrammenae TaxID=1162633 RepID=A0A7G9T5L5_9LACO|nr:hypothetical protein [Weissella diestrammenae]MCM0582217.1 hypothetical protein [Weissella diestrammenae]QNN75390.1 hypothetical protein H9L19_00340 [Weissella diestrammenae]
MNFKQFKAATSGMNMTYDLVVKLETKLFSIGRIDCQADALYLCLDQSHQLQLKDLVMMAIPDDLILRIKDENNDYPIYGYRIIRDKNQLVLG